jgi:hypothetical protein
MIFLNDDVAAVETNPKAGVDDPIPTNPFLRIVNIETPVEEATLNGLSAVEVDDCTLKENKDDVALIPVTVPLSKNVEVPTDVADNQRVAKPRVPPLSEDTIPNVEVATHLVDVPVVQRT